MFINPPRIDPRDQGCLAEDLRKRILRYCDEWWKDEESIRSDKLADTLIRIFSRMMEIAIQRLNKAPDKNFLAFLDLIGVRLLPPRAARAVLYFKMAKGSSQYGFIPAGTQVATAKAKDQEPVIFETEKDLTIIQPNLIKAVSLDPANDRWDDHTPVFFDKERKEAEALFKGKELVPHRLYIAHNQLFGFKEEATITLDVKLREREEITLEVPDSWEVRWYCFSEDAEGPKPLSASGKDNGGNENVVNLLSGGQIIFQNISGISERILTGFEKETALQKSWTGRWIFAELKKPIPQEQFPEIGTIKATVTISPESSRIPDIAFFNNIPIDLTKDFYPLGEKPRFNDTFYIGSEEVFSKESAGIKITVNFSEESVIPRPDTAKIELHWEFWDGTGWKLLKETTQAGVNIEQGDYHFLDSTNGFTQNGEISFTCPKIEKTEINGKKNHWIRMRITGGDYGKEAFYQEQTEIGHYKVVAIEGVKKKIVDGEPMDLEMGEKTEWVYIPSTFKPPSIQSLSLEYSFSSSEIPQILLTYNDFTYNDLTYQNQTNFDVPETEKEYFKPFQRVLDEDPTLYLGFDKDIRNLPVTIFFPFQENMLASYQENPPIIVWDYWAGNSWSLLNAEDNTVNFTKQEMVQFIAPNDMTKRNRFGEEHYWIRARLAQGDYELPPKLSAIYTNTIRAYNEISVSNEVLGSGNGKPGQIFKFSHFPVLPGQTILVRENTIAEEDRKTILFEEGKDAITEKTDDAGNIIETWVRWHEVEHFFFSGPNSRHYMIDRNKGLITFGDAQKGMIPPFGKDNIKCSSYQYGGGRRGNVNAETITQLKTTFPYVDSVTNPEAADGGADQEDLDMARIRGPQTIKHWDRAVTSEDFEWLVREASSKVFKVKCMPTTGLISQSNPENGNGNPESYLEETTADLSLRFRQGRVTIIIVPESEDQKSFPSQELIREIEEYLLTRISTCLATPYPLQINLIGPGYIRVGVEASVKFRSIGEAKKIEGMIIENLKQFFHPLYGGPEKKGWDFGRNVYISEVFEVIEKTEGVDYVETVSLNASTQIYKLTVTQTLDNSVTYPKHSRVTSEKEEREITFSLAERFPKDDERDILTVTGFKEGDCVILSNDNNSLRIVLKSICDDVLKCEPIWTNFDFPAGSIVETTDKRIKSFIKEGIHAERNISSLKVAIFEQGDTIVLRRYVNAPPSKELSISSVTDHVETIFIEDNYLVYSGTHGINAINVAG